jgi:hypothetical protein
MAKKYPQYVEPINLTENIGDSLVKINNNFWNINEGLCEVKKRIEDTVQVRTFFYYGPNSSADSTSGMQNNITSRPSNLTIENFVNQVGQLNVPAISKKNDIVYVIYQKTGYLAQQATRATSGTVPVLGTSPGSATTTSTNVPIFNPPLIKQGPWSTTSPDRFNVYSPAFIIWRLTFNGAVYKTDNTFPKFSQAETVSTPNWNNPRTWTNY